MSLRSTFSIRHLFYLTIIVALGTFVFSLLPGDPPNESMLAQSDRDVLADLRNDGLDIQMMHLCGMGELAAFEIERCGDRKYHITNVYIQHRKPMQYVDDILRLPELIQIQIGNVSTSDFVTISGKSKLNINAIRQKMADNNAMNRSGEATVFDN